MTALAIIPARGLFIDRTSEPGSWADAIRYTPKFAHLSAGADALRVAAPGPHNEAGGNAAGKGELA